MENAIMAQITRRTFLEGIGTAVAAAAIPPSKALAGTAADTPNFLWIIVDDMNLEFSCYGEKRINTPAVDGLASSGIRSLYCLPNEFSGWGSGGLPRTLTEIE